MNGTGSFFFSLSKRFSNQKSLAAAVLFLLERDDDFRLEATDPGLFATLNLMWSPLYGKINPFGMTVVNLDLYFVLGGGYGFEQVELLPAETPPFEIDAEKETFVGDSATPEALALLTRKYRKGFEIQSQV